MPTTRASLKTSRFSTENGCAELLIFAQLVYRNRLIFPPVFHWLLANLNVNLASKAETFMFELFSKKIDYEKVFSDETEIFNFIYNDRNKSEGILDSKPFMEAWISSRNTGTVATVIAEEALKGDVPSLKKMIWITEIYYNRAEQLYKEATKLIAMKTYYLQNKVIYLGKLIECGHEDQSFNAMMASFELYKLRFDQPNTLKDQIIIGAIVGVVEYAKRVLASSSNQKGIIAPFIHKKNMETATTALNYFSPFVDYIDPERKWLKARTDGIKPTWDAVREDIVFRTKVGDMLQKHAESLKTPELTQKVQEIFNAPKNS